MRFAGARPGRQRLGTRRAFKAVSAARQTRSVRHGSLRLPIPQRSTAEFPLRQAPVVDRLDVEAPVAAHTKRRNLMTLQQPVDRTWMHVQVVRHFAHGHHLDWPYVVRRLGGTVPFLRTPLIRANLAPRKMRNPRASDTRPHIPLARNLPRLRLWPCLMMGRSRRTHQRPVDLSAALTLAPLSAA